MRESIDNFTTQQRINTELTGESVPLFAPEKTENKQSLENKTGDTLTNEVTEKEKNSNAVTTPKEKEQNSQSNFTADLSDADIPTEEKVLSINANMKKYGITNDSIKSLLKNAIEKVAGLSVNNIFDIASRIAKFDKYPIRLEHIAEAIQYEVGRVEKEQDLFTISLDDIKMRMLRVPELLRIQGFSDKYFLAGNQSHQKKFIGNSVPPPMVKALIEASYIGLNKLENAKVA